MSDTMIALQRGSNRSALLLDSGLVAYPTTQYVQSGETAILPRRSIVATDDGTIITYVVLEPVNIVGEMQELPRRSIALDSGLQAFTQAVAVNATDCPRIPRFGLVQLNSSDDMLLIIRYDITGREFFSASNIMVRLSAHKARIFGANTGTVRKAFVKLFSRTDYQDDYKIRLGLQDFGAS